METKTQLSETESEIMDVLWQQETSIAFSELLLIFNEEKKRNWKKQTLSTLLLRLSDKGLIKGQKQGRTVHYRPCFTRKEYAGVKTKQLVDSFYAGSAKNFIAALYDGNGLTTHEIEELKQWLADK